jgi:pyruvate,water dikinase
MEGASVQTQWKSLVAGRKEEFAAYEDDEPAHHFSTYGPVYHHNSFEYVGDQQVQESEELLKGIGCYPGVVEQPIKLIFSPEDELTLDGQILCTVRTDPGWAPLFPTAGGILVERGSTLSHSAVVARELGIPAVVNIPGLTKMMENGERVRMDGGKGTIERLDFEATEEEGVADVDAVDA